MILLFIITSVLYLLMVGFVLYLYYTYHKDYEELENRLLQLEKQKGDKASLEYVTHLYDKIMQILVDYGVEIKELKTRKWNFYNKEKLPEEVTIFMKEVDNMACKKGRGGRKK